MTPVRDRRRRDLTAISADAVAFSLMVGAGETYIPAFALALGMGEVAAGLIVAVPLLAGAVIQLVSPRAVRWLGSHRRWVVGCAAVQGFSFGGFVVAALVGSAPSWVLFAIATVYWAAGLATGPAWNTWVGRLVPRRLRAAFFARRGYLGQAAVLVGLVGAGWALQVGARTGSVLVCFALVFAGAGLARLVSATFLWTQSESEAPRHAVERHVGLLEWLRRARHGQDGRLLVYMIAVTSAVQLAAPFFTPYMLQKLQFSYSAYLTVLAVSFGAKIVAFPLAGRLARRVGAARLLYVSGIGIIPLSALWVFSEELPFLLAVQVLSGPIWATYELATFLLLFEHIHESERTSVLTTYNVAHAGATVGGALLGGAVLSSFGATPGAYVLLFALSGLARAATVPLLLRVHPARVTAPRR